ncbi:hypothetical protein ACIQUW_01515 [Streptomyces sp. NPDC101117]|uniref:hypothetical protein n=1 Tax=Streptomyces sp. NPDC101117 TaxID=3366108 RepID=UPI003828D6EC
MTVLRARAARSVEGRRVRLALALSGWVAAAVAALAPDASAFRVLVTTAFLFLGPGAAAVRWTRLTSRSDAGWPALLETGLLTLVLSACLAVVVSVALYLIGGFTMVLALVVLAAVTSVLALLPGERR